MTVRREGAGLVAIVVWVAQSVVADMHEEAMRAYPKETGGVLHGYQDDSGSEIAICAASGPGPRAVHRKTSFVPDHAYHIAEVARVYRDSGRRWCYLGDWHSHPDGACAMSVADRRTLDRIAGAPKARIAQPLMLILANGSDEVDSLRAASDWKIGCWRMIERPSLWRLITSKEGIHKCECRLFNN